MLTVNEIFYSIQGESDQSGRPCVFVRLTGCDLRCVWCDTPYAFRDGRALEVADVIAEVGQYRCDLVEITGGEPLLQEDVYPLMDRLVADGATVLLETGGQLDVGRVPTSVIKVMDIKCPGSAESGRNVWGNLERLTNRDQVKFIIADRVDYEFARDVVRRHTLATRCGAVLFSPVHDALPPARLGEWVLGDHLPVRVQIQLHKYLWGAETRGV
ncbi:MAG: 7-carboxy-7-deazaguanine synthase [Acidobacteria bacterium]|jgi:7-carboxy-7-deazaguanine synthase|nr:7-carboxy-7-deazaguanine synthase [Acidobacteriota bacterium]MDP7339569.1 radical SAM protein [Vicinamibacterales bacterium]MDP7690576.1 radical SAM protein [Vicinamibacterales bacterium]HJN45615.1 radical SAM protein [Vicinamibacterales bacterium]|tara:strand:+ start:621 stop:1262 length:642 start_codon:yes stop_codon:yes gene_type:complete